MDILLCRGEEGRDILEALPLEGCVRGGEIEGRREKRYRSRVFVEIVLGEQRHLQGSRVSIGPVRGEEESER